MGTVEVDYDKDGGRREGRTEGRREIIDMGNSEGRRSGMEENERKRRREIRERRPGWKRIMGEERRGRKEGRK